MKRVLLALCAVAMVGYGGQAEAASKVTVLHGIPSYPGADLGESAPVTVKVNGGTFLTDFKFRDDEVAMLPAGDYQVEVWALDDTLKVIDQVVSVPADGLNITLIAHLTTTPNSLGLNAALSAFVNSTDPIADRTVRLGVRHAAWAPAVDVIVSGRAGGAKPAAGNALLSGVTNGGSAALDVPAQPYVVWLRVTEGGNAKPVLTPANLQLEAGNAYYIFAVGALADGGFQYIVQVNP